MSNNNYDAFRTSLKAVSARGGGAEHEERRTEGAFHCRPERSGIRRRVQSPSERRKVFRLKEKAGFHVISIDENRPPLVQVVGDNVLIAQMLAFAISEIIENSVKNGVPREQAEGMFRIALELGIATSRN